MPVSDATWWVHPNTTLVAEGRFAEGAVFFTASTSKPVVDVMWRFKMSGWKEPRRPSGESVASFEKQCSPLWRGEIVTPLYPCMGCWAASKVRHAGSAILGQQAVR
jgi:hypothetical protein